MTVKMPGGVTHMGAFRLDATKTPKEILVIGKEDHLGRIGIYRFDGDDLVICMGELRDGKPALFATRPRSTLLFVTLRRESPPPEGARK